MVMINAFNGAAIHGPQPGLACLDLVIQIPLALLAKYFQLGPLGVFIAIPVSNGDYHNAYILFRRGSGSW
jgi:hypothetical protein